VSEETTAEPRQWWWSVILCLAASLLVGAAARDPIVGLGTLVLIVAWVVLGRKQPGPPVLALAFSYQWLQVMAAPLYRGFTGRAISDMRGCDWTPMVLIGLGSLSSLLIGITLGVALLGQKSVRERVGETEGSLGRAVPLGYFALTVLSGPLKEIAFTHSEVAQILMTIVMARLGFLFLLFRRLAAPPVRPIPMALLLLFEVLLGFAGFFATFREAFMMAILAIVERFDRRRGAHWIATSSVVIICLVSSVVWTGIKRDYRRSFRDDDFATASESVHLDRAWDLAGAWWDRGGTGVLRDVDQLVSRVWCIYYPALAFKRVPAITPHQDGRILTAALLHVVTPRILNPEKENLSSESNVVRRYSGVWVAGDKQQTSIAFGYVGEAYVDLGLPLMFLPIVLYGMMVGLGYRALSRLIRSREIFIGASCAVFWQGFYLYERSWVRMLGIGITAWLLVGLGAVLVDRVLYWRRELVDT
jgi:hypothetical protein